MRLVRGRVLDNTYRLLEEIGRGGFGAVFRAVRMGAEGTGPVAVKVLNPNPALNNQDYVRFQREATFMSQLVHPGIVSVYELGEDNGSYYIIMEFVSGPNLRDFVKSRGGRLALTDVLDILVQASEALEYVHAHNLVHRDIKPQNILVCESRDKGEPRTQVKLVDFGVARLSFSNLSVAEAASVQSNEIVGTYAYMAPEATGLTDWELDHRADIYSLGVVAYELLAGRTPFSQFKNEELLKAHVEQPAPPMSQFRPQGIPPLLEKLILKCIAKRPEERYQSMFALVCDLKRILSDLKTTGSIEDFELARKDFGLDKVFRSVFVGRTEVLESLLKFLSPDKRRSRLSWAVVKGGIGVGKSRLLGEIRTRLEHSEVRYLYIKFSESESRLPFQALSLGINEYLAHFERFNSGGFKEFLGEVVRRLGEAVYDLTGLIPSLRQYLNNRSPEGGQTQLHQTPLSQSLNQAGNEDADFDIRNPLDRRYAAPSSQINLSFVELLSTLVGNQSHLVFLMDDIHVADSSTVALFQFMLEQLNQDVNFSFVLTMRDKFPRTNIVLEGFIRRLSNLKRRFHSLELSPFGPHDIGDFFEAIGFQGPPEEFIKFVHGKCEGSPQQLHALVKQMLAHDALVPHENSAPEGGASRSFLIQWDRLSRLDFEVVNIEILISQLDSLEKRDLTLMRIAAVSYDACEFEYFRIEGEFSKVELETRLLSLVKRGIFEIIGDENAPIYRRAFLFAHEKLRNAVLLNMDSETRRDIHFFLAKRIELLYKNPGREHILALAKHYDGAGTRVQAETSVRAFLRAARIFVRSFDHNLARYYIDKALERLKEVNNPSIKAHRLREVYEAEYMIFAAQGNLVAASETCKKLIQITDDPIRRQTLQIFWAQLLLGLGRHSLAFQEAESAFYGGELRTPPNKVEQIFMTLNSFVIGTLLYNYFVKVALFLFPVHHSKRQPAIEAVTLMTLAQFHGCEADIRRTLFYGTRLDIVSQGFSRWTSLYGLLQSALHMRNGEVKSAYRIFEDVELSLEKSGMSDAQRWARVLRALWLDYPMGRIDWLLALFENPKNALLPTSGLLHFESYGMRSWLRLMVPSSVPAREAANNEDRRRRRADERKETAAAPRSRGESLLENNNARRILDSGENGQYTSLALFADAFRYALSDKVEPLRRANEQLRRQVSRSTIGDAFASYAFSLQSLLSGRHKEALNHYLEATKHVVSSRISIISLPVSDGLRLAVILLPLLAISFRARNWPWGENLRKLMHAVDENLTRAEGIKNPRRNAISSFYMAFIAFFGGKKSEAFALLEAAIKESRTQRMDLIECLSLSVLGGFCGQMALSRAREHFLSAHKLAHTHRWSLIERQILGMAKLTKVDLKSVLKEDKSTDSLVSRERQTSLAISQLLLNLQRLRTFTSAQTLIDETTRIAIQVLEASQGMLFLLEPTPNGTGRDRFVCRTNLKIPGKETQELEPAEVLKFLSKRADSPVRVILMEPKEKQFHDFAETPKPFENVGRVEATRQIDLQKIVVPPPPPTLGTPPSRASLSNTRSVLLEERNDDKTVVIQSPLQGLSAGQVNAGTVAKGTQVVRDPLAGLSDGHQFEAANIRTAASHLSNSAPRSSSKRSDAPKEEASYLIMVALLRGVELLGWIVVPGVSNRLYARLDPEQDLVLIGLHSGYTLGRLLNADNDDSESSSKASKLSKESKAGGASRSELTRRTLRPLTSLQERMKELVDGELLRNSFIEIIGEAKHRPHAYQRIFRLKGNTILMVHWIFDTKTKEQSARLTDILSRHLQFLVYSLKQKSDNNRSESLMLRLYSDFTTIFETIAKDGKINLLDVNIVLFDATTMKAIEGDFGSQLYSFSGASDVENEFMQELSNILVSDRLVYRERVRKIQGPCGWLFASTREVLSYLPRFAQVDFVDRYLAERKEHGAHLGRLIRLHSGQGGSEGSGLAFFVNPPG
jgi:serine/threonine protein kinase